MSARILASGGRSLGGRCRPSLTNPRRALSSTPATEAHSADPPPRRRHPQSFVSPDYELGLGELETELPPRFHQDLPRRDRGPMKPRKANDGRDSYWRPPWKNPRAEIVSAEDFANRPRVTFGETFASLHDAMAVFSWMGQEDKDGMYNLYCDMMTSIASEQEKKKGKDGKGAVDKEWGVLSAHTSHEYVVRVVAQEYNVTTSRAAGVIQLQHNEEQLKKDPDFKVNHALQAHVDQKVRENIREVYRSYGEKDPLQFVEDPIASARITGREAYGSPTIVKASELTDVEALTKKVRAMELADARRRIDNHVYVEDVDDRTVKVKCDQEVARLLRMKKEMGEFYDNVAEGGERKEGELDRMLAAADAEDGEGGDGELEAKLEGGSPVEKWKPKRSHSVFVKNILFDVTSEDLREHMSVSGDVVSAEILLRSNGKSLGRAIVAYTTPEAAQEAIATLHDTEFKGRNIMVAAPVGLDGAFEEEVQKKPRKKAALSRAKKVKAQVNEVVDDESDEEGKSWAQKLWDNRGKNLPQAPPKKAGEAMGVGRTRVPKTLNVPLAASPFPENNRGHKEELGTRRPRWKYTAQIVNTHMQENPKGSKRRGKKVARLGRMERHGRVVDGNTIVEEGGALRIASVAELETTSWKHVRNESEFMFKGVKEAWLRRQLEGEVGGWGRQEEENRPEEEEPAPAEGGEEEGAEGEGDDESGEEKEGETEQK